MQLIRILAVVALQTVALVYMIVDRQHMLDASRVATLKVVPVDPRDLFRGDYVVLSYDISRLDVKTIEGEDTFASGDTAYVTVRKSADGDWSAVSIAHKPGTASAGDIPIRATVMTADDITAEGPSFVSLTFGVESYFVPQGTGHDIEQQAREHKLSVDVAVDEQGRAAIKAIRGDGKVFYAEGIF
jgi:uncharacterized membrane-anchored protein